jgi:hypothetical protein
LYTLRLWRRLRGQTGEYQLPKDAERLGFTAGVGPVKKLASREESTATEARQVAEAAAERAAVNPLLDTPRRLHTHAVRAGTIRLRDI